MKSPQVVGFAWMRFSFSSSDFILFMVIADSWLAYGVLTRRYCGTEGFRVVIRRRSLRLPFQRSRHPAFGRGVVQ